MLTTAVTAVRTRHVYAVFLVVAGVAGTLGCAGPVNVPAPSTGKTISFAGDIQPIFDAHCTVCHVTGGRADREGIALKLVADESYALLVDQPSVLDATLTLVVPDAAAASLLFVKVSSDPPPVGATMPLIGARLSSADLGLIRDWIDQGALDN